MAAPTPTDQLVAALNTLGSTLDGLKALTKEKQEALIIAAFLAQNPNDNLGDGTGPQLARLGEYMKVASSPAANQDWRSLIKTYKPNKNFARIHNKPWKMQVSIDLLISLKKALQLKLVGRKDDPPSLNASRKTTNTFNFFWSGPGRGKSLSLQEFKYLCELACQGDEKLMELMNREYYEFRISLEEGNSLIQLVMANPGSSLISTGIVHQLTGQLIPVMSDPLEVIQVFAKAIGKPLKDLPVIISLDGVQEIPKHNSELLMNCFNHMRLLLNDENLFAFANMAGTFLQPVEEVLKVSGQQYRVYVPPLINGKDWITDTDYESLVEDTGGVPRLIEYLQDALTISKGISPPPSPQKIAEEVLERIDNSYFKEDLNGHVKYLLARCFSGIPVKESEMNNIIPGSNITFSQSLSRGLFDIDPKTRKITVSYFFLHSFVRNEKYAPQLRGINLDTYNEFITPKTMHDETSASGFSNFEHLNANKRIIQSLVLNSENDVTFKQIHHGARFCKDEEDSGDFKQVKLMKKVFAKKQTSTKCNKEYQERFKNGEIKFEGLSNGWERTTIPTPEPGTFIAINRAGASAGDSFATHIRSDGTLFNEVIQSKARTDTVSESEIETEREKSCDDGDYFVFIHTGLARSEEEKGKRFKEEDSNENGSPKEDSFIPENPLDKLKQAIDDKFVLLDPIAIDFGGKEVSVIPQNYGLNQVSKWHSKDKIPDRRDHNIKRTAIVDRSNFVDYFGPFAGRAFRLFKRDEIKSSPKRSFSNFCPGTFNQVHLSRHKLTPFLPSFDNQQALPCNLAPLSKIIEKRRTLPLKSALHLPMIKRQIFPKSSIAKGLKLLLRK